MNYNGYRIIDSHAHFPGPESGLRQFDEKMAGQQYGSDVGQDVLQRRQEARRRHREGAQAKWRAMWGFPTPEARDRSYEEQATRWIAELDKWGIERIVWVTNGDDDNLARVCQMHPDRFIGYVFQDLFNPKTPELIERGVKELGLKGYKFFAPLTERPIADKDAYKVWETVERLEIPVLIHFGPLGGVGGIADHMNMSPMRLHDVAKDFPTIPFIVPHFGCGYPTDLLQLGWACPNVYVDTSGSNEWIRWMFPHSTLEDLFRKFAGTFGAERIIFGTDSSWFPRGFAEVYLSDQMRICHQIGLQREQIQHIFADNIARLLKLD